MNVIRLKKKNICILLFIAGIIYLTVNVVKLSNFLPDEGTNPQFEFVKCSKTMKWHTKTSGKIPASQSGKDIDIFGPPGSGVEWFRMIVEQLTGLYTGSTETRHPKLFAGEGRLDEVLAIMSYDVPDNLPKNRAAIVVYRNLQDTIRTHFLDANEIDSSSEPPFNLYYGNAWKTFAVQQSKRWSERYASYFSSRHPIMVVIYDEFDDRQQIQAQLLRLSNFVRVPVKHSALQCIMKHAAQFPLKPPTMKTGFEPFKLLSPDDFGMLEQLENSTKAKMELVRSLFRPNV